MYMWKKQNRSENSNINGIFVRDPVSRDEKNDKLLSVMTILKYSRKSH